MVLEATVYDVRNGSWPFCRCGGFGNAVGDAGSDAAADAGYPAGKHEMCPENNAGRGCVTVDGRRPGEGVTGQPESPGAWAFRKGKAVKGTERAGGGGLCLKGWPVPPELRCFLGGMKFLRIGGAWNLPWIPFAGKRKSPYHASGLQPEQRTAGRADTGHRQVHRWAGPRFPAAGCDGGRAGAGDQHRHQKCANGENGNLDFHDGQVGPSKCGLRFPW